MVGDHRWWSKVLNELFLSAQLGTPARKREMGRKEMPQKTRVSEIKWKAALFFEFKVRRTHSWSSLLHGYVESQPLCCHGVFSQKRASFRGCRPQAKESSVAW